jgi:iron(III) transport system ATP-binding protein
MDTVAQEPIIRISALRKRFRRVDRSVTAAVDGVNLDVAAGEFLVLLGPSGCGKTTLLRCLAGLETPDEGAIELAGHPVFDAGRRVDVAPERRGLSMMFQSYALWPHMSVASNVSYPLENRHVPRGERAAMVREALELVGIGELARQFPGEMSGGQQQRVALARALVAGDRVILFDEPLSNVDAKVRERLRVELLAMQRRLGFAAVYVTHDQTEAMELASRIAVMRAGRIAQLGRPRDIYEHPATRYVANFVGVANEIPGRVERVEGGRATIAGPAGPVVGLAGPGLSIGQAAVAVWRPQHGRIGETRTVNTFTARRLVDMFAGSHIEHHLTSDGLSWRVWSTDPDTGEPGGVEVPVSVDPDRVTVLPADDARPAAHDRDEEL